LKTVGLGYLTLDRSSSTLSGGEGQRIRLATQIGSQLRGVLYVLDEPSIGLHPRDNQKLLETLSALRDLGNTVLVVEHDEETIRRADYVVDLGPGAARTAERSSPSARADVRENPDRSPDSTFAAREDRSAAERRAPNGKYLTITGAYANNLKEIDVSFPLGLLTVVTVFPVPASPRSSKTFFITRSRSISTARRLSPAVQSDRRSRTRRQSDRDRPVAHRPHAAIESRDLHGLFTPLRELYAMLPESRERGYKPDVSLST
jgi:excinuclease ABC subunit A